jgi:hypothetical protein
MAGNAGRKLSDSRLKSSIQQLFTITALLPANLFSPCHLPTHNCPLSSLPFYNIPFTPGGMDFTFNRLAVFLNSKKLTVSK